MFAVGVLLESLVERTSRFPDVVMGTVITCDVIDCSTFLKGVSFVLGMDQVRTEGVVRLVKGLHPVVAEDPLKLF